MKKHKCPKGCLKFETRNFSSTIGPPSVLFVASDWGGLRMFQAIVDERTPPSRLGPFLSGCQFSKGLYRRNKEGAGGDLFNRTVLREFQGVSVLGIFHAKWGFNFKTEYMQI